MYREYYTPTLLSHIWKLQEQHYRENESSIKPQTLCFYVIRCSKIEGVVLNRVHIIDFFCPKQGQGFKPSAAHLYPNIGQVPPGLACENIRFSTLFAAGDVSRGGRYSARNVPGSEERRETDVFAGYPRLRYLRNSFKASLYLVISLNHLHSNLNHPHVLSVHLCHVLSGLKVYRFTEARFLLTGVGKHCWEAREWQLGHPRLHWPGKI